MRFSAFVPRRARCTQCPQSCGNVLTLCASYAGQGVLLVFRSSGESRAGILQYAGPTEAAQCDHIQVWRRRAGMHSKMRQVGLEDPLGGSARG
eukprot:15476912-Alexandrium_andersonii.AAC.1